MDNDERREQHEEREEREQRRFDRMVLKVLKSISDKLSQLLGSGGSKLAFRLISQALQGAHMSAVVGTPSTFGVEVVDQAGVVTALPAGVTPTATVDGGAAASISADFTVVTVNYPSAGTYNLTVSDASGKVASASVSITVTAPVTLSFKLTQLS